MTTVYQYGYIDKAGKEVIAPQYDRAGTFSEGLAAVGNDIANGGTHSGDNVVWWVNPSYKYGFIDKTGKEVVPLEFDYVKKVSEGMAAVGIGEWIPEEDSDMMNFRGKWGFIAVTAPAPNNDTASAWAQDAITNAVRKGFVPAELQTNYKNVITRAEFCRMAVKWLEYFASESVDGLLDTFGLSRDPNAFTDTNDPDILAAHALGITKGTGNGEFTLNSQFTREEAATMIMNVCKLIRSLDTDETAPAYADIGDASPWAVEGINFCRANGIMLGVGDNRFNPKATFTIEQSIQTFSNIR